MINTNNNINNLKNELVKQKETLLSIYKSNLNVSSVIYNADFVFIGATNKALANISAFWDLINAENYLIAFALIRVQLDILLRFFAVLILDKNSRNRYMHTFLEGERIDKLQVWITNNKGKNIKQNLTDSFLCKYCEQTFNIDWVSRVYKQTSKFIHMSGVSFHATVNNTDNKNGCLNVKIAIHKDGKIKIEEDYLEEALCCFIDITKYIIYCLKRWVSEKVDN